MQVPTSSLTSPKQQSSSSSSGGDDLDILKVSLSSLDDLDASVIRRASEHKAESSSLQRQIVLCGRNSTSAVHQDPLLSWTAEQLHRGRLRSLRQSLERYRQRKASQPDHDDAQRSDLETSVAHALLGIEYLHRTDFLAAADTLPYAHLDPRLVLSMFPELNTELKKSAEAIMPAIVFSSLHNLKRQDRSGLKTIDELANANLTLNYSPPMDLTSDKTLVRLKANLLQRADVMLRHLLVEWRAGFAASGAAGTGDAASFYWAALSWTSRC